MRWQSLLARLLEAVSMMASLFMACVSVFPVMMYFYIRSQAAHSSPDTYEQIDFAGGAVVHVTSNGYLILLVPAVLLGLAWWVDRNALRGALWRCAMGTFLFAVLTFLGVALLILKSGMTVSYE